MNIWNLFPLKEPTTITLTRELLHATLHDRMSSYGFTAVKSRAGRVLLHTKSHQDPYVTERETSSLGIVCKEQFIHLSGSFIAKEGTFTFKALARMFMTRPPQWLPHFIDIHLSGSELLGHYAYIYEPGNGPMEQHVQCVRVDNPIPELFGLKPNERVTEKAPHVLVS